METSSKAPNAYDYIKFMKEQYDLSPAEQESIRKEAEIEYPAEMERSPFDERIEYDDNLRARKAHIKAVTSERLKAKEDATQFARLKLALIDDLKSKPDGPYIASGLKSWTRYELANEIEGQTETGTNVIVSLLMLTLDLLNRGKEHLDKRARIATLEAELKEAREEIQKWKGDEA